MGNGAQPLVEERRDYGAYLLHVLTELPQRAPDAALLEGGCAFAKCSSQIPGIVSPYVASSLISNGRRYYYVAGSDNDG